MTEKQVQKIQDIPVGHLYVSPDEARKTIDQSALNELAASIAEKGVLEALLVRTCTSSGSGTYEIVSGQRRWLAAKQLGEPTVPCIVYSALTDDEAAEMRMISNLQREGLKPMEEAEAYKKLLEHPGATVESVAAALGKSPSYVCRRLLLLQAIEPVRQALSVGAIEVGHALELARLTEVQQGELLTRLNVGYSADSDDEDEDEGEKLCRFCERFADQIEEDGFAWADEAQTRCTDPECLRAHRELAAGDLDKTWTKTPSSVADLRRLIEQTALRDLNTAAWPLDVILDQEGYDDCLGCPRRTRNASMLFSDLIEGDTCTDRACFDRKTKAWIGHELQRAADEKRKLVRLAPYWTSEKSIVSEQGIAHKSEAAECDYAEDAIWIDGKNAGRRLVVCRDPKCTKHAGGVAGGRSGGRAEQSGPQEKEKRAKTIATLKAEKAYRSELFTALAKVEISAGAYSELMDQVIEHMIYRLDSSKLKPYSEATGISEAMLSWKEKEKLPAHLKTIEKDRRVLYARLTLAVGDLQVHEYDRRISNPNDLANKLGIEELAEVCGLDWKAIRSKHISAPKKPVKTSAAKPAGKKAAAKKSAVKKTPAKKAAPKKKGLTPDARKRIAGAVKKRWASGSGEQKKQAAKTATKKVTKK